MVLEVVQFECSHLYCVIHQDRLFYYIQTLLTNRKVEEMDKL